MLQLALTPSANDIFAFHALAEGLVPFGMPFDITYADLQELNESVLGTEPDVCKISLFTLGNILKDYILLPTGAALGYGNGPKIVSNTPCSPSELFHKSIGVPGKDTTAYLLLNVLIDKPARERFCRQDEVIALLKSGQIDTALLFHESSFAIDEHGLHEVLDLGSLWEERTGCPLPLAGIVAKRQLGSENLLAICQGIQRSLAHALSHPEASRSIVAAKVPGHDEDRIQQFLRTFVNQETWHLSSTGVEAIQALLTHGRSVGLLPSTDEDWLFRHPSLTDAHYPITLH